MKFASTETKSTVPSPGLDHCSASPEGPGRDGNKPLMRNRAAKIEPSPTGSNPGDIFQAEQYEIDWEAAEREWPLKQQWARNAAAEAENWTEEALCIAWVTQSDGRHWRDWWAGLPSYERERFLNCYRFERQFADSMERPMRPFTNFAPCKESQDQDRAIIESFKAAIMDAAVQGRPMPLRESPEMNGFERMDFQRRLRSAMMECGVVIVQTQPETKQKP